MVIKTVVLDFDGTLTNEEKESVNAVKYWKLDLANYLGQSIDKTEPRWNEIEEDIIKSPENYSWFFDGIAVSTASGPFTRASTISRKIILEEDPFIQEKDLSEAVQKLYYDSYSKSETSFKPDTDWFLNELKSRYNVFIVTNSLTDKVTRKIHEKMNQHSDIPIIGNARKHHITTGPDDLPEYLIKEGFRRPSMLRRGYYDETLKQIMANSSTDSEGMAVVGDIYELDLLLPEYRGMKTILARKNFTLDAEVNAMKSYSRGSVANSLKEAASQLKFF